MSKQTTLTLRERECCLVILSLNQEARLSGEDLAADGQTRIENYRITIFRSASIRSIRVIRGQIFANYHHTGGQAQKEAVMAASFYEI